MSKKIFDIIPPHLLQNKHAKTNAKKSKDNKKMKNKAEKKDGKKISGKLKGVLVLFGILLVFGGVYLYFKLAFLTVEIWPAVEAVNFEQEIKIEESLEEIDLENKKIPAQFVEEEKDGWQEFAATGSSSKEGIARGTIRVYNKYSPAKTISLVAKTRFLSDSGKLFRSVSKINVPAAQTKSGKLVPGWVDVEVTAVESGESYNIGPSTFSIPGLSGTAYYYSVYAESTENITGGYESELKMVTANDIEDAKNSLEQKLFNDAEDALRDQASVADSVLFSSAINKSVIESSCSVKAGTEVGKFNCEAKVKIRTLAVKEADLQRTAKNYILSQIPDSKKILEETLILTYNPKLTDLDAGTVTLDLAMSADIHLIVNTQAMALDFMGKDSSQINDVIYAKLGQEISKIRIEFWPLWVKKAPKDQGKIKVQLMFD